MQMAGVWSGPRDRREAIGGEGGGQRGHGRRRGRDGGCKHEFRHLRGNRERGDSKVSTIVEVDLGNRGAIRSILASACLDEPNLLQRVLVVTNTTIASLYLDKVFKALTHGNYKISVESVILPDGEANMVGLLEKPLLLSFDHLDCNISIVNQFFLGFLQKTLMKVFDKAVESRMDQHCTFVALGGGVIGDMCGFAAAFLHGVNFIQILTTLIA